MKDYRSLLTKGQKIGGAAVGGAIGSLTGPEGNVLGAALGAAVSETCVIVLTDLANRFLSPKEEQRVAGVAALSIDGIRERQLFEPIRSDDFFDDGATTVSAAEEIFEGVLLSAKQEHEQLKLPLLAKFYANLVFESSIKRSEANYLLSIAESLTYTQLCLLGLCTKKQKRDYKLRERCWMIAEGVSSETESLAVQAEDLKQRQLFYQRPPSPWDQKFKDTETLPRYTSLSTVGERLANLMELHNIENEVLKAVADNW
ncbi:hypothetical protein [Pseudomonas sp. 3HC3]|uniref:hypothetical protein n=1 Tax=Pseudomonas sp. 3HC3 TaxID=2781025 RepID=UPI00384741CE